MNFAEIIQNYTNLALQYNVDPRIFVAIYVIMTPLYYYGFFRLAKTGVIYRRKCKSSKRRPNMHELFKQKGFVKGYVENRTSWAAPYVYVVFWGTNLPRRFYALIFVWMAVGFYIFYHSLEKKVLKK